MLPVIGQFFLLLYLNPLCYNTLTKSLTFSPTGSADVRGVSCETQLCATYHDLAKLMNSAKITRALILDFKKAFDKVPYLLQKLKNIANLDIPLMNWIPNFLTRRTQKVVVNSQAPSICDVTSCVPQGFLMGSTLFLLYINNLPGTVTCNTSLYADDTLLYQVNPKLKRLDFQTNIDAVYEWPQNWETPFNVTKCPAITFCS